MQEGSDTPWALIIAVALAVLREGAETVLFVTGFMAGNASGDLSMMSGVVAGTTLGVAAGSAIGLTLYAGLSRIPVRRLFSVTNTMVLLLAAGFFRPKQPLIFQDIDFVGGGGGGGNTTTSGPKNGNRI